MVEAIPEETLEREYDLNEDQMEKLGLKEEQQEQAAENAGEDMGYGYNPLPREEPNLFNLFKRVLQMPDSSKVGNLNKLETGDLGISVRDCQRISLLAHKFGHEGFGEFFDNQGQIILRTSSSKKGWLPELFVSQKRFSSRESRESPLQPELQPGVQPTFGTRRKKWKLGM